MAMVAARPPDGNSFDDAGRAHHRRRPRRVILSDDHRQVPMNRDICCINFKGLLAYLRRHHGERGVDLVCRGLVENPRYLVRDKLEPGKLTPVSKRHLEDPACWVSDEFSRQLLSNVERVVPGPHALFKAGQGTAVEDLSNAVLLAVKLFGPRFAARQAGRFNRRFNRTKEVSLLELSDKRAVFELKYLEGFGPDKVVCDWNRGIYSGLAIVAGATVFSVRETKCVVEGDQTCVFEVLWREAGLFKRLLRWLMREGMRELEEQYQHTVAERDRLIEVLSDSEKRHRLLTDHSLTGIYIHQDGRFTYINPRLSEIMGYAPEEILGRKFWEFVHPDDRETVASRGLARSRGEVVEPNRYEFRVVRKDGGVRWLEVQATSLELDERSASMGNVYDVTERRLAEDELRHSRQLAQTLIDTTQDTILLLDAQGVIVACNQAWAQRLGKEVGQLVGTPIQEHIPPAIGSNREMIGRQVLATGQPAQFEDEFLGRYFDYHLRPVFGLDGQPSQVAVYARDVTERHQAEERREKLERELRHAQKMEAIGTLAGGIAHDFNNILGAVLGFTEIALEDSRRGLVDPRDLEQVLQSVLRARNLVRQILTFSQRIEAELKPLDLNQQVAGAVALLGSTLPKMIQIVTNLEPDIPPVRGNATQVEQVLLNLASNAADAMPEGGRLTIETRLVHVRDQACPTCGETFSGDHVLLTVADTGQGMDEETLARVFDPFFTTKGPGKGTGLGLSSVYGIVQVHRGHISCRSQPGQGAVFDIHWPVDRSGRPGTEENGGEAPPPGRGESLLLVDDESALREVGRRILTGAGYQVRLASTGEEALEVFRVQDDRPDLVVLDLGMPGMGGQRCLQEMLALDPRARVVIASGYAADMQVRQSLEAGAAGYVAKPFRRADLLGAVRRVLDTHPA